MFIAEPLPHLGGNAHQQPCAPHRVRVVVASAAAQLYDVRRDQQLAGRAGQPDGSPFLLFELGCEIVPFATHNSQIFVLSPSCLARAV